MKADTTYLLCPRCAVAIVNADESAFDNDSADDRGSLNRLNAFTDRVGYLVVSELAAVPQSLVCDACGIGGYEELYEASK